MEARISIKKQECLWNFSIKVSEKKIMFRFNNFILEKTKIFMETILYHQKAIAQRAVDFDQQFNVVAILLLAHQGIKILTRALSKSYQTKYGRG